jgi:signal transduction histidine kinase
MNIPGITLLSPSLELVLLVVALVTNGFLAYGVLRSDSKSATNVIFVLLSIVTSLWLLNNYITGHISISPQYSELALLIGRFGIFFAAPMSALFFLLAHTIPERRIQLSSRFYYAVLGATVGMMILNLSPFAFTGVELSDGAIQLTPGPGLAPFSIISTLFSALAVYLLLKKYISGSAVTRRQLGSVLLGILLMLALIIFTILLPVLVFNSLVFLPFTPLYTLVFLGMTAYAITKYQLFNIKILVTQAITLGICVVLFAKIFTEKSIDAIVVDALIFLCVGVFGYFLVQSVRREVEQRELIQRQAEELEEANRQQESLLHFISHEVKGYLTKSEAAFAAIHAGDFGSITPELYEMSGTALTDVRKGVDTVINILDASNLKRGTVTFARLQFDFAKAVDDIVSELTPAARAKGLQLSFSAPRGEFLVVGDEDKSITPSTALCAWSSRAMPATCGSRSPIPAWVSRRMT